MGPICDDLCRSQVTPRLMEQSALSVALAEHCPLQAAPTLYRTLLEHYSGFLVGVQAAEVFKDFGSLPLNGFSKRRNRTLTWKQLPRNSKMNGLPTLGSPRTCSLINYFAMGINEFDFLTAPGKKVEHRAMFRLQRLIWRRFSAREVTCAVFK